MNSPHSLDIGFDKRHWPVFHDLAILNHLPISAYSGLMKFDMKIYVNVARLEIGQLFTKRLRRGHLCILEKFLVLTFIEVWTQWVPCKINVTTFGRHVLYTRPIAFILQWMSEKSNVS